MSKLSENYKLIAFDVEKAKTPANPDGLEFDTKMKARNKNDAVRKVKADEKIKCFTIIGEGIKSIEVETLKNRRRVT